MNPVDFANNLCSTCKNNLRIREDGKELTIFDRISDFFHGKHGYDHFLSMCKNFSQDAFVEKVKCLSKEEQIEILGRIRQIQKRITNQDSKDQSDAYIKKIELNLLSKNVDDYSDVIFAKILNSAKNKKYKIDSHIRNLEEIIQYFSDEESISKIISNFNSYLLQSKNHLAIGQKKFFNLINKEIINILLAKEEKILLNSDIHKDHYNFYPVLLRLKLENEVNSSEIYNSVSNLNILMAANSNNSAFIKNCLEQIDQFLENSLFHSKLQLSEMERNKLLLFEELFPIIDKHLPLINTEKNLVNNLKIKCANLPCFKTRTSYPNLFLSEKNQLNILLEGLQKKEDEEANKLCEFLKTKNPSLIDVSRLAKLVSKKSSLSNENRLKIKTSLESRLKDKAPQDWEDYRNVKNCLENIALLCSEETSHIETLRRIDKSKLFFRNQIGLAEDMILIPRWHHATNRRGINGIISSGKIKVSHEKAFKGAWVSTAREKNFGSYALSLSNKITDLDPGVFIGFEFEDRRWRGIQKVIPLQKDENVPHLVVISVPKQVDKLAKKIDKLGLIRSLKETGFPNPKAFSIAQLDFIQKEVISILGTPNLPPFWWGSGKIYNK